MDWRQNRRIRSRQLSAERVSLAFLARRSEGVKTPPPPPPPLYIREATLILLARRPRDSGDGRSALCPCSGGTGRNGAGERRARAGNIYGDASCISV